MPLNLAVMIYKPPALGGPSVPIRKACIFTMIVHEQKPLQVTHIKGTGGCLFLPYALSIKGIARSRKTG